MATWYVGAFIVMTSLKLVECLNNGLALTPPMGWLSWERYRCITDCDLYPDECISEWLFRNVSDLMVSEGYAEAGYEYVIIDDCWLAKTRDENGRLQPDPDRFPSGIKALADYIHSKGLKFGIYEDYGTKTCAGYPGIIGHMETDAETFASWDVDYVKLDGCNADPKTMDEGYPRFGRKLNKTGRPMVYSCSWPVYQEEIGIAPNFTALVEYCNLWRNYDDIDDSWASLTDIMDYFARKQDSIADYAGPGHWNDPDMLLIGNFGLSVSQAETQMAVWSILAAPLIMSTDLANISPEFKTILQNQRVIAINQDPLGIQGRRVLIDKKIHVWLRPISPMNENYYSYAAAFVSRRYDGAPYAYNITVNALGLHNPSGYLVTDLFSDSYKQELMVPNSLLNVRVKPSGVVFLLMEVVSESTKKPVNSS
ncbi:alpha-N-acetylgalactosaminidase-like [Homalodisca vitripennis]|uniref:alpha-N-acetylgalactosaminidase-like n=1 Tax=Homalodisca vitripennis TaxID=197043 RepID=UPI001EEC4D61|nr:alpha-N-acetylgalactosaminidase-like [Homalodisca vitripennis]XP_046665285.1 alpha-N-acetylgalactosaminidase-like [Homalodisca vitripennis]XP_046665286.1 alpha-N-acetylgalactosaminidase-like [Homalodisca vitripennis]XP_046665287.1 alpha-N-acetylgalactosaminidase-like [Homalodisca vitripennis]